MPAAQILRHLVVLRMPTPHPRLLRPHPVLVGRDLRHVVPELVRGGGLLQRSARIVRRVVQRSLGRRTRRSGAHGRTADAGRTGSQGRVGQGAARQGRSQGVRLLRPGGLVEGCRVGVLVLDGEGRHGVEGAQLLGVELLPEPGPSVGEPDLHSRLGQFGLLGELFSGVDVGVLGAAEGPLQGLQLFAGEGRAGSSLFAFQSDSGFGFGVGFLARGVVVFGVTGSWKRKVPISFKTSGYQVGRNTNYYFLHRFTHGRYLDGT